MAIFGAHVSSSGGIIKTFERARAIGAQTFQFFLRSPRAWRWRKPSDDEMERFSYLIKDFGGPVVVHAPYLINPASADPELRRKSIEVLKEEILFCEEAGISYYNLHPGTARGIDEDKAIENIVRSLEKVINLVQPKGVWILLETTAGEKGDIGKNLREMGKIIAPFDGERIGVCLDTCHLLACGYAINEETGFLDMKEELENFVGINSVKIVHANDSKVPKGGRRDRHEHIGEGYVGIEGFKYMICDKHLGNLPYIIETPKEGDMDAVNLKKLREIERSCGL